MFTAVWGLVLILDRAHIFLQKLYYIEEFLLSQVNPTLGLLIQELKVCTFSKLCGAKCRNPIEFVAECRI